MTASFSGLEVRRRLGRNDWAPPEQYGPDGWYFKRTDGSATIIVSVADHEEDRVEWLHASMARPTFMPDYEDLVLLHHAVFGDGFAFQVFVPRSEHVNLHQFALHLWGRLDGKRPEGIPDFGRFGTI